MKPPKGPCVYRCYGRHDVLIYVGATSNLTQRIWAHGRGVDGAAGWMRLFVHRITVEPFHNSAEACAAELVAIANERPLLNEVGARRTKPSNEPRPKPSIEWHAASLRVSA